MNNKNTIIILLAILVAGGIYWYSTSNRSLTSDIQTPLDNGRVASTTNTPSQGKIAADIFYGKLEEVNTGCFADGECFVVVEGKHVTTTIGWNQDTVGTIQGVPSFGDLENHIGEEVEVYAQEKPDGTYTLYGSEGFYVKLK